MGRLYTAPISDLIQLLLFPLLQKVFDLPLNIFLGNRYTPRMMLYVSTNDRFLYIESQAKPESISQRIQEPDAMIIQDWDRTLGLNE